MTERRDTDLPDGIDDRHPAPVRGLRAHASPLAFVILAALLAIAATGSLRAVPVPVTVVEARAASLEVKIAHPLRSGLLPGPD